ncbi:MAG: FixH family protein [Pseudomonadales bacterium]
MRFVLSVLRAFSVLAVLCGGFFVSGVSAKDLSWQGSETMMAADKADQQATELIREGSQLRKLIKDKRQQLQSLDAGSERDLLAKQLASQAANSVRLQRQGGEKRKLAKQLREQAVDHFATDMQQRWPSWVKNIGEIRLTQSFNKAGPGVGAHNSSTRSVHPNKQKLAGKPLTSTAQNMSLALPELSGQQLPAGLDTRSFAVSRDRRFVAHIEVQDESVLSGDGSIELNELHRWHLLLTDIQGAAISGANILFGGHMPGHVHGLPTQPRVSRQVADGVYEISGVKFQMRGWWVIELQIKIGDLPADNVRFNLTL